MKNLFLLWIALAIPFSLAQTSSRPNEVPTLIISSQLQITLFPGQKIVGRSATAKSITLVYQSNKADQIYRYHDRDLLAHGWARSQTQAKQGRYSTTYEKGRLKASLQVVAGTDQVSVTVRQD